jgi:copper chaperone CopZ
MGMRTNGVSMVVLLGLLAAAGPAAGGEDTAETRLAIEGMTCGGCVAAVKVQLGRTQGVTAYDVSLSDAKATVTYDPARTTPSEIAASVSKTGFRATVEEPDSERHGEGVSGAGPERECAGGICRRDCCQSARAAVTPPREAETADLVSLAEGVSDAVSLMRRSLPQDHHFEPYLADRDASQPEWDIYLFFAPGTEWTDRAPAPSRWVRQTALFGAGEGEEPTSLLWTNAYASAPIEGSLVEELRRLAPRPAERVTAR